ncbi:MAG TPA: phosphomannomutase [Candidatus Saccharimonadales bacterium]|nr:phosphomannomutase [Candidatus Saccharimonadales bacterium]
MGTLLGSLKYTPNELKFGTSGLRGLVTDMTDLECYINTVGFLVFLQKTEGLKSGAVVYLAGDLRDSTPRIMRAVHQAITDAGFKTVNCSLIPTPAVAYYALQRQSPCIMVTGSHIPADRNGIKFYKTAGEVLKEDEQAIFDAVHEVRERLYAQTSEASPFDIQGMLESPAELPRAIDEAGEMYLERYKNVFTKTTFAGRTLVFYQHSAVGRDMLAGLLEDLGATVITVGRSDTFVPIDSENVTPENQAYFRSLAKEYPGAFAIVSTDGDSDRPFVIDEQGVFHRGDVLGAVVANWLKMDFAAYPVSASDAVDSHLDEKGIAYEHTKIGSPYVVEAMQSAEGRGKKRIGGWEVNGGFLLGCTIDIRGRQLKALPTRDAIFPIIVALLAALEGQVSVSQLFASLPARFTQAGLIDNFPVEISKTIVRTFSDASPESLIRLGSYFSPDIFGEVTRIDALDGIRIFFSSGDIAHLRPSGNAPQLRIYSVADSQKRADEIVARAIAEPDGIFRKLEADLKAQ